MEATASAPAAVAGSSTTNNNNRVVFINNATSNPKNISINPPSWRIKTSNANSIQSAPLNRPLASLSSNVPVQHNRQTSAADSISMTSFPPIRTNNPHNSTETNNTRIFSPRRRRNDGEQKQQNPQAPQKAKAAQNTQAKQNATGPQNAQASQNAQGPRNAQDPQNAQNQQQTKASSKTNKASALQAQQEPPNGRVLVTGYPTYTQPHDILEVFTKFGNVRIDKCNSFSATLTYASEEQAKNAIGANKRLHIYGHFLSIRPYSAKLKAFESPQSPKRDFSLSKQKCMIIEPDKIDLSGDFHSQLDRILAAIRLNQEEINRIQTLYRDLEMAFITQWPGCKAVPFGSITTGLGIKTSDADCFISLPVQFRVPYANFVNKARRLLMLHPHVFAEILAIPRANTPIVKFYHVPTGTNCDLTFKTPLGAQNSRLIAFLLHADPRITPMAVIIKYWAKVHDLSGTGKLTNYTLTLMIIFYLQQLSIIPSVEWLQRDRSNDIIVDCWNTGYMSNHNFLPRNNNKFKISEFIGGFFEYYANFDFDEMVVCPYLGTKIKKTMFADTASLPNEYALYKQNVLNNYCMPIRYQTSFCVQDPFEQCHNVASTVTSRLALDIRTFFNFAAAAFEKEKSNNCARLLPIILLEKPKLVRPKSHVEYRVNLFPRIINTIINFEWKGVVRDLVTTIFEKMLKIKLGKVEEKMNPDSRKEKEKYTGSLTKPIWKRKRYNCLWQGQPELFEEKQSFITEELIKREEQNVGLQFQLILTYCHDPKSAVLSMRFNGGDFDGFREFGKFFISVMQSWFTQLLKPHSMPNCKDTAAKIAATAVGDGNASNGLDSDDDDEEEIVLTPRTKPAQEKRAEEKTSVNISDFTMAGEDVREHGDTGPSQDSVVNLAKDSVAEVAKNTIAEMAKVSIVDVAKDNVADVAKDSVTEMSIVSIVDVSKDSVAEMEKVSIVGVAKDSDADVAKDNIADMSKISIVVVAKSNVASVANNNVDEIAKDSVAKMVKDSVAETDEVRIVDVAKDGAVDMTKVEIVGVAKPDVVDLPLDVPQNGADDVSRASNDVPSNGAHNASQYGAKMLRNDVDELQRDVADVTEDVTQQGVHDKPLDDGDKEKVTCASQ